MVSTLSSAASFRPMIAKHPLLAIAANTFQQVDSMTTENTHRPPGSATCYYSFRYGSIAMIARLFAAGCCAFLTMTAGHLLDTA